MNRLGALRRRLLFLFRRRQFDRDLEEEIAFHLEMRTRANGERGLDAEEARYAARRQFGNATALRERSREAWGWPAIERLATDVKLAVRALPGVVSAAAATCFPNEPANTSGGFEIEGRPTSPGEELTAGRIPVTTDYFRTAGITLRAGRLITGEEPKDAAAVVVVNEALARRYLRVQDPIGRRLRFGRDDAWRAIVGVVGNLKGFGVDGDPMPAIYLPRLQTGWGNPVYLLVRTGVPPLSLAATVRKEIRGWNKRYVLGQVLPMEDVLSASVAVPRFYMLLVAVFAALALALAAVGVYGLMSYSVAQRTHEIGVRMALGADRSDLLRLVVGQGFAIVLTGLAFGLAGAWAFTRVLASLLFRVRPNDGAAFVAASLLLVAATLLACYVPARRASRVDPMVALRYE